MNTTTSEICVDSFIVNNCITIHQACYNGSCRACARKFGDGYIVIIKETLSTQQKWESFIHEITHIHLGHLDDDTKSIMEKEREVSEFSKSIFFYTFNYNFIN